MLCSLTAQEKVYVLILLPLRSYRQFVGTSVSYVTVDTVQTFLFQALKFQREAAMNRGDPQISKLNRDGA
jgi:hypothetical protein